MSSVLVNFFLLLSYTVCRIKPAAFFFFISQSLFLDVANIVDVVAVVDAGCRCNKRSSKFELVVVVSGYLVQRWEIVLVIDFRCILSMTTTTSTSIFALEKFTK